MKKRFLTVLLSAILFTSMAPFGISANAQTTERNCYINFEAEGYYFETLIEEVETPSSFATRATEKTITRKKTTQMKNSAGDVLWYVSATATFTYDGTTARCISCTPNAGSNHSAWAIRSTTSSINGNSGTATATARYTSPLGTTQDITQAATLTCTAYGVVS